MADIQYEFVNNEVGDLDVPKITIQGSDLNSQGLQFDGGVF